jgi:hypothetical protein
MWREYKWPIGIAVVTLLGVILLSRGVRSVSPVIPPGGS